MKRKKQDLNYGELVTYIHKIGIHSEEATTIMNTNRFQELLEMEKILGKNDLLCISIINKIAKLDLNDNDSVKKIISSIREILDLQTIDPNYSNDLKLLTQTFLNKINDNWNTIEDDNILFSVGIELLKNTISHYQNISKEEIEFFLKQQIKSLKLDSICTDVKIISKDNDSIFGVFKKDKKTIILYYDYLQEFFSKISSHNKVLDNSICNLLILKQILEIIGDVYRQKLISINNMPNVFDSKSMLYNTYIQKEEMLKNGLKPSEYEFYRNKLINQKQSEIFSIFKINELILTLFSNSFDKEVKNGFYRMCYHTLVSFYTENNKARNIKSPIEQFDHVFNTYYPKEFLDSKNLINYNSFTLLDKFNLGLPVPTEIIGSLFLMYTGQKNIENPYSYIKNYENKKKSHR